MKKITAIFAATLIITPTVVLAAPGEIAGDVYRTDIKTYFFDKEINSYNIGGQTVVIAEDLSLFGGFDVKWDAEDRRLTITDEFRYSRSGNAASEDKANLPVVYPDGYSERKQAKHIYTTDIVTELKIDGTDSVLASYNIGGYTCIVVEDLMELGYRVIWDGEARELRVYHDYSDRVIATDIGDALSDGKPEHGTFYSAELRKISLSVGEEVTELESFVYTPTVTTIGTTYVGLNDLCQLTGLKYGFSENALAFDTTEAKAFEWRHLAGESRQVSISDVDQLYLESVSADGEEFRLDFEWWTMMGSAHHVREVGAMVVDGKVFVPVECLRKLTENNK